MALANPTQPQRTLRNRNAITTGRLELSDYDDLFSSCRLCAFTDIDASIERHGYFLYVEMKKPTEKLTTGQRIYWENRVRDKVSTAIVRWGNRGETECIQIVGLHDAPVDCSEDQFRQLVKGWWDCVDAREMLDISNLWESIQSDDVHSVPQSTKRRVILSINTD